MSLLKEASLTTSRRQGKNLSSVKKKFFNYQNRPPCNLLFSVFYSFPLTSPLINPPLFSALSAAVEKCVILLPGGYSEKCGNTWSRAMGLARSRKSESDGYITRYQRGWKLFLSKELIKMKMEDCQWMSMN